MIRVFFNKIILSLFFFNALSGQDISLVRKDLRFLTSKKCFGRGYVKHGQERAAGYLINSFRKLGLQSPGLQDYSQKLIMSVNTFPNKMKVLVDGKKCAPGKDFLIENTSCSVKGKFFLDKKDSVTYLGKKTTGTQTALVVSLKKKLTWSVAREQGNLTEIQFDSKLFKKNPKCIDVDIEAVMIDSFAVKNICGYLPGTTQPDSFIFFSAHYDHL